MRPLDQNGDHANLACERGCNLQTNEVFGTVQPSPIFVLACKPTLAYEREQNLAGADILLDQLHEVLARLNVIYVHENLFVTEVGVQAVEQTTGVPRAVAASVADEDSGELFGRRLRHRRMTLVN